MSYSPGINRRYRAIGIFLTISPVRHSNRQYSSIVKNRGLLHKYLMVYITSIRQSDARQMEKRMKIERTEKKEKGHYIPIQDYTVA